MSPFVDDEAEGYVPDFAEEIKKYKAGSRQVAPLPLLGNEDSEDPQNLLAQGVDGRAKEKEDVERKKKVKRF